MVVSFFPDQHAERRFVPYIAVHEFEALLFRDTEILARHLGIDSSIITTVVVKYGSPEAINNNPMTAPSKRLERWIPAGHGFLKTTMGIAIAEAISIEKMRDRCPVFDDWLRTIEGIQRGSVHTL
jgi:hypothetical protein